MSGHEAHVCAVCRTVLDRWTPRDGSTSTWVHTLVNEPEDGHAPVAVPRREMTEVHDRCDFCGQADPVCMFVLTERLGLVALTQGDDLLPLTQDSDGLWAACGECAAIIETGSAARLAARVARHIEAMQGRPVMRDVLYKMYVALLAQPRLRVELKEDNK